MSKSYIKLKYNEYGYDIYAINSKRKVKLNKQDKIIMRRVLNKFDYIQKDNDTYIYPNYRLITLYFSKSKLELEPKKVNRKKSSQVISGILAAITIITGANSLANESPEVDINSTTKVHGTVVNNGENQIEVETTVNHQEENIIVDYEYTDIIEEETIEEFLNTGSDTSENTYTDDILAKEDINTFSYEYSRPNDKAALNNSQQYMETFLKYEKIYGVDANLLCAIGAQESSGIHHSTSKNGGYATGLMGIEYIWDGGSIRVYNFETNSYETIVVDYSRIGELDYNIKIGAAIFQNYFYNTLKNSDSIEETEYLAFTLQKYNMGPGNMHKVLSYGDNWVDNRDMINAGDKYYFEHVLSRFDNDTILSIRLTDGSYYETKLINESLNNHYSRG